VRVTAHLLVGAVLYGVRSEDSGHAGKAEGIGLSDRGVDEFGRRNKDARDSPTLQINDVVHTARRTTASIGERLDDQRALGGNLLAEVDRCRLRERWLLEAQHLRAGLGEQ
jgi:hypothetical protein